MYACNIRYCNFNTTDMTEAEPQAVLKILTEHNFQDAFKEIGRSAESGPYKQKGTISTVMVASRSKFSLTKW
jgi:hypothetical protein